MVKIEWSILALEDASGIVEYISEDNPDAALKLFHHIKDKVDRLPDHPKLYKPGREPGTREMVVTDNYIVVYRESEALITILRVLHAAQKMALESKKE